MLEKDHCRDLKYTRLRAHLKSVAVLNYLKK